MIANEILKLLSLKVGYNIEHGKFILRSLDDGSFAVSFDLENPSECWEEEFDEDELEKAIEFFLMKIKG